MTNKLANRVKVTVSGTPGTGSITLSSALPGFQTFAAGGVSNSDTVPYVIEDGSAWEIGVGTYSSTGPTLARTTITASSNSGSAITASSSSVVMLSPLAADLQSGTSAGNLVELDSSARIPAVDGSLITNLNVGNAASGTLSVARGGTGLTSLTAGQIPFGAGTSAFGSSSNLFWDSANAWLGIGTSSPGTKLNVYTGSGTNTFARVQNTLGYVDYGVLSDGSIYGPYATPAASTGMTIGTSNANPIRFWTNASERMRIDSSGRVGIGVVPNTFSWFIIGATITGQAFEDTITISAKLASDVTGAGRGIQSQLTTGASASYNQLIHFYANPTALFAGSTVTTQFGFHAENSLTTATNNFGFYSNIASGTGRWNFYANGTAANYFAGQVGIGTSSPSSPLSIVSNSAAYGVEIRGRSSDSIGILSFKTNNASVETAKLQVESSGNTLVFTNGSERLRIDSSGKVLIGTSTAGASKLTIADDSIQINTAKTPASATDTGTTGQVCWDSSYIYVCTATNTWKRSAIATW